MRMVIAVIVLAATAGLAVRAQSAGAPPRFDVASIRPSAPDDRAAAQTPRLWGDAGGKVNLRHIPLTYVLMRVFNLQQDQIIGPAWLAADFFDILATAPADAPKDQIPFMFQSLLAERFGLKYHPETRIASVYTLIFDTKGPKMKEAVPIDLDSYKDRGQISGSGENRIVSGTGQGPYGPFKLTVAKGVQHFEFAGLTMAGLAAFLSQSSDHPVIDSTELKGSWQVTLDQSFGTRLSGPEDDALGATSDSGDALRESLQRLGLKLVQNRIPSEKFVIDHIERMPAEN